MDGKLQQYFLLTETIPEPNEQLGGLWRFILQQVDGPHRLEVSDTEPHVSGERLELFAVVRGLEAIDGASHVTLVTSSRYIGHGIRFGLDQWRDGDWQWERFGEMTAIKNRDLWQRIDRALAFHSIECRVWRLQSRDGFQEQPAPATARRPVRSTPRLSRWLNMPIAAAHRFGQALAPPQQQYAAN